MTRIKRQAVRTRRPGGARKAARSRRLGLERLEERLVLSGEFGYVLGIGGVGTEQANDVTTDTAGNVYITGQYQGTVDFDPSPGGVANLTSAAGSDAFVAKYSPTGSLIWARSMGGTGNDIAHAVTVDAAGDVVVVGEFTLTASFGALPSLTSAGSTDIFVTKLDASGNFQWAKRIGSTAADNARGVAVDSQRNIHVVGDFEGTVDFDPDPVGTANRTSLGSSTQTDVFALKLTPSGTFTWVASFGASAVSDIGQGIAVDASGNVLTTGILRGGTNDFDPGPGTLTLPYGGQNDVFVSKLNSTGSLVWAKSFGSAQNDAGAAIGADAAGNVFVTGTFAGTVDFNPDPGATYNLTTQGTDPTVPDVFVTKLAPDGSLSWAGQMGGPNAVESSNGLALDPAGNVYVTGTFSLFSDFDPDPNQSYILTGSLAGPPAADSTDAYVVKLANDGHLAWARDTSGLGTEIPLGVAADALGHVYAAGSFAGTSDFDPDPVNVANLTSTTTATGTSTRDIFLLQLASGTSVQKPSSDGYAIDSTNDGTFESVDTTSDSLVTKEIFSERERGLMEFDLSGLSAGVTVRSATLTVQVTEFDFNNIQGGVDIGIYGYTGDGTVTAADATAPAVQLGQALNLGLGTLSISLDPAAFQTLLASGPHPGLMVRLLRGDGVTLASSESPFDPPPTLTLDLGPPAGVRPPRSRNDAYALDEDTTLNVPLAAGVLHNDDTDRSALTATLVSGPAIGSLTFNADGTFSYTPPPNFAASNDPNSLVSFTYRANDGTADGNLATVFLIVNPVDDPPVGVADSYSTNEDTPLVVAAPGVLANDTDIDSTTLTATLASPPGHGSLLFNSDGSFRYTPASNFNGTDSFTYRVSDGQLSSAPVTVTITVNPVNDAPVAANDSYTTAEDTPLSVAAPGVLANDTDVDGDALTAVLVSGPAHGTLTLNANGSLTYTPAANYNGPDSFTYRASDGSLTSNVATVSLTVNPVNDAPVAVNDAFTTAEDTALVVPAPGVLANDTDVDSPTLTAGLVAGPAHGTLALNADGSFTYTPAANFNGTDSFTYRASDGSLTSNLATVTLTVTPVNDAPVAGNDAYTTAEDTPLSVVAPGVLGNDSDVDGDALSAILISGPAHGVLTLSGNGSLTYTPAANYNGPDSFTYQASDGSLTSNVATVNLTVTAVDDAPVAANDSYTTAEDTALVVAVPGVLGNDSDVDGDALTAALVTGPAHGTLALSSDGSFTYTPAANFNGTDSFTYRASDGSLTSNLATVTLTVTAVNDAPVAVNDAYTTAEDTPLSVATPGVLSNDSDVDGDGLTAILVSGPAHGTLTLNGNGSLTYTPAANYNGPDSFTYRASDGSLTSNVATVTLTITAVNDAPVAANDSYTTAEDTPLSVAAPGVLGNDSDVDGDALTTILVSGPAHGSLTLNANGSFAYTPAANFNGPDSFTYRASDGSLTSNVATVSLTVTAVNDAPVAANDAYTTAEDTPLSVATPGVLANDSDVDGDALAAILVSGPAHGTLTLNGNGSFTYTPAADYNGPDSFTYRASDGSLTSNVAVVSLTITPVNDPPRAVNDSYTTAQDTPLTIAAPGVLGNDTDVDSSVLTAVLVTGPAHGTLALNSNGSFTYTPASGYAGSDSFTYQASDGSLLSGVATVSLTINAVNHAPTAADDAYTTAEDTALVVAAPGVLGNDSDVDGNVLTAALVTGPAHGTLALSSNGSFTYTPAANFNGTDSFTYRASDGSLTSNVATVTLTVTPVNDAPVAANDAYTTAEDTALVVAVPGVLGNDSDVDGDALTAILVSGPAHGTLTLNANGSFAYTPAANYNGPDSFTYKAGDGSLSSNIATVSLTVTPVNDAPVAGNDAYTTAEDTPLAVAAPGVLGNDSDVDSPTLTASLVTGPAHGTLALNANGSFTYTPAANFNGTDSFTYRASDGSLTSNLATVTFTVTPVNDAPVAANDSYTTAEDTPLSVAAPGVLGNDSDVDGDALTAILVSGPAHGTLALNSNGSFTYSPAANYNGPDSFTYRASDGSLTSNVATVALTVTAVNDAPVAANDAYTTAEDTPLSVATPGVLGNDSDVDGDALSAILVSGPAHGTLALNGNGSFTYTPAANFNGTDSFTYRASDGSLTSNVATVTLTVNPVNDAPVAANDAYTTAEDTPLSVAAPGVLGNDTDVDSPTLTAILVSGPAHGTLALNADGSFTYTSAANYNGPDSFTYRASDGSLTSNVATVSLTITPVNDRPTANAQAISLPEDGSLLITLTGSDVDGDALTYLVVAGPSHGALSGSGANRTYTPAADFNGSDSFTFKVNDGSLDSLTAVVSIAVTPVNDAPTLDPLGDLSVNQDAPSQTVSLSGITAGPANESTQALTVTAVSSNPGLIADPSVSYTSSFSTGSLTFTPNPGATGTAIITVTVRDDGGTAGGGVDTVVRTFKVTVAPNSQPLVADAGPDLTADEGSPVKLAGSGDAGPGHTIVAYEWDFQYDGTTFDVDATGAKTTVTYPDNGVYTVALRVRDDAGRTAIDTARVTVNNVAPTTSLTGPTDGVRGQRLAYTGTFTDPGTADTFTTAWAVVDAGGHTVAAGTGTSFVFVPTAAATYTVRFTVTDDDGGVGTSSQRVAVTAFALQPDPCFPGKTALVIGGTTGDDTILVNPGGGRADLKFILNGVSQTVPAPTGRIIVYGQAGNDQIQVVGGIKLQTLLDGGDGADVIQGGNGPNVILGGAGDDTLTGGNDRDLLIGGTGADRLDGQAGDDILIGGTTAYDLDDLALCAVMDEWLGPDPLADRVAHLTAGGGRNGNILLNAATVWADDVANTLSGGAGGDLAFSGPLDTVGGTEAAVPVKKKP